MRVAFLGLGIMGSRMARNLRQAGFDVVVWNRTRARAEELGEPIADTPGAAATGADVVISIVVDAPQVEEVLFGDQGAADSLAEGALVIDMSTIAPSAALGFAERLAERGLGFLEAPVSGSAPRAEAGTLTIMVGGSEADFERGRSLFEAMGERIVHCGPTGHAQMIKLLSNSVAATTAAAIAEAIDVGERYGLDLERLLEVFGASAAASLMVDLKGRPMLERDYEPLFRLAHMLKDVRHCLEEAAAVGADFTLAADAEALYAAADRAGLGERDFAAVAEAVRARAGRSDS
jgi:3-hydroxyisobutyrate dehydrogenase-like beta-hydroxyacid dehydrogenase